MSIKRGLMLTCICTVLLFIVTFFGGNLIPMLHLWLLFLGPLLTAWLFLYMGLKFTRLGKESKNREERIMWWKRALLLACVSWAVFVVLMYLVMRQGLYTTNYFPRTGLQWLQTITFLGAHFAMLFLISVCLASSIIALRRDIRLLEKETREQKE